MWQWTSARHRRNACECPGRHDFEYEDRAAPRNGFLLELVVAIVLVLANLVFVELARTLVARAGKLRVARTLGVATGFDGQKRWTLATIGIGPFASYLGIAILAFAVYRCGGIPNTDLLVDDASPGFNAVGKVKSGDRILALDNPPVESTAELARLVESRRGAPVTLTVERDGHRLDIAIKPTATNDTWRMGLTTRRGRDYETGTSAARALAYPTVQLRAIFAEVAAVEDEADPGGLARIVTEYESAFGRGFVRNATALAMLVSVYLLFVLVLGDLLRFLLVALRR